MVGKGGAARRCCEFVGGVPPCTREVGPRHCPRGTAFRYLCGFSPPLPPHREAAFALGM